MGTVNIKYLDKEVKALVVAHHQSVVDALATKKLTSFIKESNKYRGATRTKFHTKTKYVDWLLDSWMESSEQTKFGGVLEGVVLWLAKQGRKGLRVLPHQPDGVDLVILNEDLKAIDITQVKSNRNWGNKDSIKQMVLNMRAAEKNLSNLLEEGWSFRYVNLVCNGSDSSDKGEHIRLCGSDCWEYLTGDPKFGKVIFASFQRSQDSKMDSLLYNVEKSCRARLYTEMDAFMLPKGKINWDMIAEL